MTCEKCGVELEVGGWPFCPHGRYGGTAIGDECDIWQENFGDQPEHFTSKQAMLKRADQLGLRPMVRWAGPHDKHVSRWASVDLEAAKALVSRASMASREPEAVCETAKFTVEAK